MSLFQSNLRISKQIRNLPKILNFVKINFQIIHYFSKLFTSLLRYDAFPKVLGVDTEATVVQLKAAYRFPLHAPCRCWGPLHSLYGKTMFINIPCSVQGRRSGNICQFARSLYFLMDFSIHFILVILQFARPCYLYLLSIRDFSCVRAQKILDRSYRSYFDIS